jgi:imidazolonepropionase-like amidohydrolase
MKRSFSLAAVGLLTAGAAGAQAPPPPQPPPALVIENVTVLPMDRERTLPGHTVLIVGRRIEALGPTGSVQVPADAERIDGTGRFLIPGLAEMHGHPPTDQWPEAMQERFMRLNVAAGVTTVRGMLGHPHQLALKQRVGSGEMIGPQLFVGAPSLNGNATPSATHAAEQVTRHRAAGYDLLKVHPGVGIEAFDAIMGVAEREGLRVGGHIPEAVGLRHALERGIASVEHLDGYIEAVQRDDAPAAASQFFGVNKVGTIDEAKLDDIVALTRQAGAYVTPTQALFVTHLGEATAEQTAARPEMAYWPAETVAQWTQQVTGFRSGLASEPGAASGMLEFRADLIRRLRDAGVPFLLGADAPQIFNVPGYATLFELETLVDAGLTPFEALQSGTLNPARFMGLEHAFGTIEVGKRADLVLLEANPLDDIANVRRRAGVVLAGRWLPASELDSWLAGYAAN